MGAASWLSFAPFGALALVACSGASRDGPAPPAAPCPTALSERLVPAPSASASTAPAPPSSDLAPEPRHAVSAPVVLRVGERMLEIAFGEAPLGGERVASIRLDGEAAYPPSCASVGAGLCSRPHQILRGEGKPESDDFGKGRDLVLLDFTERDDHALALFASTTFGSPECGTYAVWAMRFDAKGIRVTPPLLGCFLGIRGPDSPGGPHPSIAWTDPPVLWIQSPTYLPGEALAIHTLDTATMTFTARLRARPPRRP